MTQRLALIALPFLLLAACGPVEKKADEAGRDDKSKEYDQDIVDVIDEFNRSHGK